MAKTFATITNEIDHITYVVDQPLITVEIMNIQTGFKAKGHAKCDPTDRWNENFGVNLAYARALNRLTKKLERYYVNSLSKFYSRS